MLTVTKVKRLRPEYASLPLLNKCVPYFSKSGMLTHFNQFMVYAVKRVMGRLRIKLLEISMCSV